MQEDWSERRGALPLSPQLSPCGHDAQIAAYYQILLWSPGEGQGILSITAKVCEREAAPRSTRQLFPSYHKDRITWRQCLRGVNSAHFMVTLWWDGQHWFLKPHILTGREKYINVQFVKKSHWTQDYCKLFKTFSTLPKLASKMHKINSIKVAANFISKLTLRDRDSIVMLYLQ